MVILVLVVGLPCHWSAQKFGGVVQDIVQAVVISLQYRQFVEFECLAQCCSAAGPNQVVRTMSNNT